MWPSLAFDIHDVSYATLKSVPWSEMKKIPWGQSGLLKQSPAVP